MQDSNLRPLGPKPSALPSCANHRHLLAETVCRLNGCGYYRVESDSSNLFYKKMFVRSLLRHLGENRSNLRKKTS